MPKPSSADPGSGSAQWETVLTSVLSAGRCFLEAAACSVAVISDSRRDLVYVAADGQGASAVVGMRIPVTEGVAGFVAGSGQSITINDVRADPRFSQQIAEQTGYVPTALTVVPLQVGGETIGILSVLDSTTNAPPGAMGALAGALAAIVDLVALGDGGAANEKSDPSSGRSQAGLARAGRELARQVDGNTELGHGERQLAERLLLALADHLDGG